MPYSWLPYHVDYSLLWQLLAGRLMQLCGGHSFHLSSTKLGERSPEMIKHVADVRWLMLWIQYEVLRRDECEDELTFDALRRAQGSLRRCDSYDNIILYYFICYISDTLTLFATVHACWAGALDRLYIACEKKSVAVSHHQKLKHIKILARNRVRFALLSEVVSCVNLYIHSLLQSLPPLK